MDFWHSVGVVDGLFWAGCSVKDVLSPTHHMFRNEWQATVVVAPQSQAISQD